MVVKLGDGVWLPASREFIYTSTPSIVSYLPPHGPTSGNTTIRVVVSGFLTGSNALCMFGPVVVPAVFITEAAWNGTGPVGVFECTTLPTAAGAATLQLSPNGQQFSAPRPYVFYADVVLWDVYPLASPARGDTPMAVSGGNHGSAAYYGTPVVWPALLPPSRFYFSDIISCRYTQLLSPPDYGVPAVLYGAAHNDNTSGTVVCTSPPLNGSYTGNYSLAVALNGQQVHAQLRFIRSICTF